MKEIECLKKKLSEKGLHFGKTTVSAEIVTKTSMIELRDNLFKIGNVMEEDLDNSTYISSVRNGLTELRNAYIAAKVTEDKVYVVCSSKEGLIKQHNAEKALNALIRLYPEAEIVFAQ